MKVHKYKIQVILII